MSAATVLRRASGAITIIDLLSGISWDTAAWASDPLWTPPADGAAVSSWRDGSGNSHTLTQATGAKQPIFRSSVATLGNRPGIEHDGVDDVLASPVFTALTRPLTLVVVGRITTVVNSTYLCGSTPVNGPGIYMLTGTNRLGLYGGSAFTSTLVADTSAHLTHGVVNGASSKLGRDGTEQTGNAGTIASNPTVLFSAGFNGASAYAAQTIGFIGLYAGDITALGAPWTAWKAKVAAYYGLSIA